MTSATVQLLLRLLDQVTLQGSDPNLEQTAAAIVTARRELEAANGRVDTETVRS